MWEKSSAPGWKTTPIGGVTLSAMGKRGQRTPSGKLRVDHGPDAGLARFGPAAFYIFFCFFLFSFFCFLVCFKTFSN
jgi:hypothetical protein